MGLHHVDVLFCMAMLERNEDVFSCTLQSNAGGEGVAVLFFAPGARLFVFLAKVERYCVGWCFFCFSSHNVWSQKLILTSGACRHGVSGSLP